MERYERGWNCKLPTSKGLDNHEMVQSVLDGKLKAMYMDGEDMFSADSNAHEVGEAFSKLEFFVVQDIFFSETCRFADVILPGQSEPGEGWNLRQYRAANPAPL